MKERCFVCLQEGHLEKKCMFQNEACVHCGKRKKHHPSLCPNKFGIRKKFGIERNGNDENITPHEYKLVAV